MTKLEVLGISSGMGALNLVKNLRRVDETEVLQFSKRAYTSKYPAFHIPSNLSSTAMKRLKGIISVEPPTQVIDTKSDVDKDADTFKGNSDYDEKTNIAGA